MLALCMALASVAVMVYPATEDGGAVAQRCLQSRDTKDRPDQMHHGWRKLLTPRKHGVKKWRRQGSNPPSS